MKPLIHAQNSAKKWGGLPCDYLEIHNWFDQTKAHFPDMRHRAILHSSFGIFMCEQHFGVSIVNSSGKEISVRDIGEWHVLEDLGFIPTIQDYLKDMPFYNWLGGKPKKATRKIKVEDLDDLIFDGPRQDIPEPTDQPSFPAGTKIVD